MAIPTSYTEKTLAEFMYTSLGQVAPFLHLQLGEADAGDFAEVVNDTLLIYGTNTISTVTGIDNIHKLRLIARARVWQYVVTNFTVLYDFSADGATYHRGQVYKNAVDAWKIAFEELGTLQNTTNYAIKLVATKHINDPYAIQDEEENSG